MGAGNPVLFMPWLKGKKAHCPQPQLPSLQKEEPLPLLPSDISSSVLALWIPAGCNHLHGSRSLDWPLQLLLQSSNAPRDLLSSAGPPMIFQPLLQWQHEVGWWPLVAAKATGCVVREHVCPAGCSKAYSLTGQLVKCSHPLRIVPGRQSTGSLSKGFEGRHS